MEPVEIYRRRRRRRNNIRLAIEIFVLIVVAISVGVFYMFAGASKNKPVKVNTPVKQEVKKEEVKLSKVSLSFVGDLLMHTAERKSGYNSITNSYNFNGFFADIKPFFENKDYVIGSFESPIAKENVDSNYSGYPSFKNPPEFIEAVKNAGINMLVTSNNHVLDQGEKGVLKTMEFIDEYKIPYTGTFKTEADRQNKPNLFFEKNGIKMALMNYTETTNFPITNSNYLVNYIEMDKIKKDIEFAKASKADMVIVWLHFGTEYQRQASDKQEEIVKQVAKLGADIIIGSHPHVIEPIEVLDIDGRKVLVAYSLGNFVSNQYWRYSTDGMILNIDIEKQGDKTSYKNVTYIPTAVVREYKGPEINNEDVIKKSDKDSDFITGAISKGTLKGNEVKFRIIGAGQAMYDYKNKLDINLTENDYTRLKTTWEDTTGLIGESEYYKIYRDSKTDKLEIGSKQTEENTNNSNEIRAKTIDKVNDNANIILRGQPDEKGTIVETLKEDVDIYLLETLDNGWFKAKYNNNVGYIDARYVITSMLPKYNFSLSTKYKLLVKQSEQKLYIYKDGKVEKEVVISTGTSSDPTPNGIFRIEQGRRGEWFYQDKYSYGFKYWVGFKGSYLFHSIVMDKQKNILKEEEKRLGTPSSHGCIRVPVDIAKYIYDNVSDGANVLIEP